MWRVLGWSLLVAVCCAAAVAHAEAPPDARLREARTALDEAATLWDAGRYDDAIARGEHALALREAVLGDTHPDVAGCLVQLGAHHLLRGNPARAEPLLTRALTLQEAALGQNHPEVARTLTHLAQLYQAQGSFERAEPLHARALAIREAALGQNPLLVAESLNHLAQLYQALGSFERSKPLLQRALAIREAALGQNHPELARTLNDLASVYSDRTEYARAEPLFLRAVAIWEAALGQNPPELAIPLSKLIELYEAQGLVARADPLYPRLQSLLEAAVDKNPPNVAVTLRQLALHSMRQGMFARAEPLFAHALALQEAAVGKSHPVLVDTLHAFAVSYTLQGLHGRAEPLYERMLAISEATFGKSHPRVALAVVSLGNLYLAQGLYARAEPFLERALAIRQGAHGEKSHSVARALCSLGSLHLAQGSYARAEPYLQRAVAIGEAVWGKKDPNLALPLSKLGNLYLAQGLYARAEPLLRRALAIAEAAWGRNAPGTADSLQELADLYSAQGSYRRARPLYERALAIRDATFGRNHPRNAEALNHLAAGHLAQHRLTEALPLFTRAFATSEQRLRQEMLGLSEVHLAQVLQLLRSDEERLYALLRSHPEDARVQRMALGAALLLKGRSVEESADISRTIYRGLGPRDRATFEQLRALRGQLAQLSLEGRGSLSLEAHQRRLDELFAQGTALEVDLARRSAPLRALISRPPPTEMVDRVAASLPQDGALIELISYVDRPLVPPPGAPEARRAGQPRYLALVLFPDATVRVQDLGPAGPIDAAAARLRHALANRDAAFQAPAQALHHLVFQPLRPLLGETRRLFLSPDGQMALVPFAALHDGHQFLVDAFDFIYLPSGRNLLPHPQESAPPSSVVVLADPDFSAHLPALPASSPSTQEGTPGWASRPPSVERSVSTLREHLAQRGWAPVPLPGTRQEAESIQRLMPQARLFLGPEATKARLLSLPAPGILHLATHGFFLGDASESEDSRAVGHFGALGEDPLAKPPADPMLRSGLVLAGAPTPAASGSSPAPPSPDSGLVTALELAGLDLWGTKLVVLSACDTGRGDVKPGQGVYGLHRAFLVAGAETVVMSLWKVNDETTRALMELYYSHLLAGQGRATALREAMRTLRSTQPHPHDWAPFITLGRDTPLHLLVPSAPLGPFQARGSRVHTQPLRSGSAHSSLW
ncbi:MAG TPA: tetratricopeptide repeat protein [Archangium sp.]|uniref:tetratricopeptide repeat protein n=1 Tax=Archangium sp. TaxID=1872627 RepID=UPI002E2FFC5D|nr:tetratricopeptide repeat protein [Archangium sp.]HEX5750765.1 tetratricopeptide repeat protein [Archangium sp.]